jgi:hypothetical protein
MTDDRQERAREYAGYMRGYASIFRAFPNDEMWGRPDQAEFAAKHMEAVRDLLLAFASPTPEPSGAVVREVEEACRLVEYDMVHRRMTPGNGFVTQTTDVATIIDYVRASLDAGSASS